MLRFLGFSCCERNRAKELPRRTGDPPHEPRTCRQQPDREQAPDHGHQSVLRRRVWFYGARCQRRNGVLIGVRREPARHSPEHVSDEHDHSRELHRVGWIGVQPRPRHLLPEVRQDHSQRLQRHPLRLRHPPLRAPLDTWSSPRTPPSARGYGPASSSERTARTSPSSTTSSPVTPPTGSTTWPVARVASWTETSPGATPRRGGR